MRPTEDWSPRTGSVAGRTADGPPAPSPDPEWLRAGGEPLPGYRLIRRLGTGGFGQVWLADAPGDFPVALKFLPLARGGRVERSALDLIKRLRHPNLLVLFGTWERDDWLVIGMEFVIDGSLADRLAQARKAGFPGLPRNDLRRYMAEAADVLDYLNKPRHFLDGPRPVGLQHGDVKPHNLLRHGRTVKLADFGLVRVLGAVSPGLGLTPAYAAPEVFAGRPTRWSDQYALAVAYCELRGGRRPIEPPPAAGPFAYPEADADLSMLPDAERPVVARALAKNPPDRWPSCRQFVRELIRVYALLPAERSARFLDRVRGDPPPFVPPSDSASAVDQLVPSDSEDLADSELLGTAGSEPDGGPVAAGRAVRPALGLMLLGILLIGTLLVAFGPGWWLLLAALAGVVAIVWQRQIAPARPPVVPWTDPTVTVRPTTQPAPADFDSEGVLADVLAARPRHDIEPDGMAQSVSVTEPAGATAEMIGLPAFGFQRLVGHSDAVWTVALTADGRTAVSGGMDGTVRVWEVPSGREVRRLIGHGSGVTGVCVSADGRTAASAGSDGTVRAWDLRTGEEVVRVTTDGARPVAIALSSDGSDLYSGGAAGDVTRWAVPSGRAASRAAGPGGLVYALAVSADGTRVAAGTATGHTWVSDRATGNVLVHLPPPDADPAAVRCLAFAPDGSRLAAGREDGVILLVGLVDPPTAVCLTAHPDWVRGVAFAPAAGRVVSVGDDETVQVHELRPAGGWRRTDTYRSADESLNACAAAGDLVVVGGESGTVYHRRFGAAEPGPGSNR